MRTTADQISDIWRNQCFWLRESIITDNRNWDSKVKENDYITDIANAYTWSWLRPISSFTGSQLCDGISLILSLLVSRKKENCSNESKQYQIAILSLCFFLSRWRWKDVMSVRSTWMVRNKEASRQCSLPSRLPRHKMRDYRLSQYRGTFRDTRKSFPLVGDASCIINIIRKGFRSDDDDDVKDHGHTSIFMAIVWKRKKLGQSKRVRETNDVCVLELFLNKLNLSSLPLGQWKCFPSPTKW